MKRSRFGAWLLIFLLAVSLLSSWAMEQVHAPVAADLEAAGQAALSGSWDRAAAHMNAASNRWTRWQGLRCCFADHGPSEQIDAALAELRQYAAAGEPTAFAAAAARTACQVEAIWQAHGLKWWNLL